MLFWPWLPEDVIHSGYSSVSQASSFHWLGPGGALVLPSPILQGIHVISSYLFQDTFHMLLQKKKNYVLHMLDLFVPFICTPVFLICELRLMDTVLEVPPCDRNSPVIS